MIQKKKQIKAGSLVVSNWTRYHTCLWTGKVGIVLREMTNPKDLPQRGPGRWISEVFCVITNSDILQAVRDKNWIVRWFDVDHHPIQVFAENALKVILE